VKRLSGKVVLVTGASRGIGAAIARRFGTEEARVCAASRSKDACRAIADEIVRAGGDAVAACLDVAEAESIAGTVAAVTARWGRIDVLVNNAGVSEQTPLTGPEEGPWDDVIAVNLTAPFRVARACLPHMPDGGRIINMSSVVGRFGVPGLSAYAATKHGVIGLTRSWALELASRRITVNAICPGWVDTAMGRQGMNRLAEGRSVPLEEGIRIAARMAPLGEVLRPEEVAGLAVYIASDEAANLTGQAIVLDGGQVMP
jgi:NAD(P)-dependent dehydrogenase (short-subunit alcohol dehydrogenase family)